jgi:hypothetical protein
VANTERQRTPFLVVSTLTNISGEEPMRYSFLRRVKWRGGNRRRERQSLSVFVGIRGCKINESQQSQSQHQPSLLLIVHLPAQVHEESIRGGVSLAQPVGQCGVGQDRGDKYRIE